MWKKVPISVIAVWVLLALAMDACASVNLVVNGDFSTGDLTGWTTATQAEYGEWMIYSGGVLPLSNWTTQPPQHTPYAATADQSGPSSVVLYQNIDLPADKKIYLTYTYYYHNFGEEFFSPRTLNISDSPNQQARIDIMNPNAVDPYSVAPSDIWRNLLRTLPGYPLTVDPTTVTYDLSAYAGKTVRIRFAVADTEYFFSMGVDNISIRAFNR